MKHKTTRGFTLIELLVVVSVIVLLVGILGPTISKVRELSFKAKSQAAIQELAAGAMQYKSEYNYYPLQPEIPSGFTSKASTALGQLMLGFYTNSSGGFGEPSPRNPIVSESNDRFTLTTSYKIKNNSGNEITAPQYTPLDQWKKGDEMAVLYYPSIIGNDGATVSSAFDIGANSAYAPNLPTGSSKFPMTDSKFGSTRVFNSDSFLLIAPGIDREYFTDDDLKNF